MFIRKCSIQLIRDVSGITPSSVRMFQPLGQNQTLIYCYVDIIQYNAMHKFVRVLDNPR